MLKYLSKTPFNLKQKLSNKISSQTTFCTLNSISSVQIEHIYSKYTKDPLSVDENWRKYFDKLEIESEFYGQHNGLKADFIKRTLAVVTLCRAYQDRGHEAATLDPLGLEMKYPNLAPYIKSRANKILDPSHYNLTEYLDDYFLLNNNQNTESMGYNGGILSADNPMKLRDIVSFLKEAYCGYLGWEYNHIGNRDRLIFIRQKAEHFPAFKAQYEDSLKMRLLKRLEEVTTFEEFFRKKYPTAKRFGIEGCESLQIGLKTIIDFSIESNMKEIVIGMPHRGRLSILHHTCGKPFWKIIREFTGKNIKNEFNQYGESGDVKYHMWSRAERKTKNGKIDIVCMPNPSHLDTINPVAEGYVRAAQKYESIQKQEMSERSDWISVILHGDASFQGQGINYELMQMSDLENFTTGGSIHVVVNNQIGFTTNPADNRHGIYSTGLGKSADCPIIHVNAEEPIEVEYAFKTAMEYRNKFGKDVVIDLIGYRKHGHNEIDTPEFTQPLMYKEIKARENIYTIYKNKLVREGVLTETEAKNRWDSYIIHYNKQVKIAEDEKLAYKEEFEQINTLWRGMNPKITSPAKYTGFDKRTLDQIITDLYTFPENFNAHKIVANTIQTRYSNWFEKGTIDWATGEALAYGSLMKEGYRVRLSGQDVKRGTFSQRHAIQWDQETNEELNNFHRMNPESNVNTLSIVNSLLSEYAVLGFEYGYSVHNPNVLVLWEAQFGDFANGAQIMIDNCIVSGEAKWNLYSGLVINMPHGYDGQGPEHSSGRIERFLQLVDSDYRAINIEEEAYRQDIQKCNIQVCYPTTPANLFHMLRRQQHRTFRKPLMHFFSKKLLRHPLCSSPAEDIIGNKKFQPVIDDSFVQKPEQVTKLVFCTGQVWVDIHDERQKRGVDEQLAICRIEQLAPLDYNSIIKIIKKYKNANLYWVQEEHLNQGAWGFIQPRFNVLLNKLNSDKQIAAVARPASAASATGVLREHEYEKEKLMQVLFEVDHENILLSPAKQFYSEYL